MSIWANPLHIYIFQHLSCKPCITAGIKLQLISDNGMCGSDAAIKLPRWSQLHKGKQIHSMKDIKALWITIQQPTDIKLHISLPFYNTEGCHSAMWPFLFYGELFNIWQPSRLWWKTGSIIHIVLFCFWSFCSVLWEFQCDSIWSLGQKGLLDRTWKFRLWFPWRPHSLKEMWNQERILWCHKMSQAFVCAFIFLSYS